MNINRYERNGKVWETKTPMIYTRYAGEPCIQLDLYDAGRAPTGVDVYNILTIAHRMDKSGIIRKAYGTFTNDHNRRLPEPVVSMCVEGL